MNFEVLKIRAIKTLLCTFEIEKFFLLSWASFGRNLPICGKALSPVSKLMSFKLTIYWITFLTFFFRKSWLVAITFVQIASELRTTLDIRGVHSATFSLHVLTNTSASFLRFKTCPWLIFPHFNRFCNSRSAASPRWTFFCFSKILLILCKFH